jgi:hypothetical protein
VSSISRVFAPTQTVPEFNNWLIVELAMHAAGDREAIMSDAIEEGRRLIAAGCDKSAVIDTIVHAARIFDLRFREPSARETADAGDARQ